MTSTQKNPLLVESRQFNMRKPKTKSNSTDSDMERESVIVKDLGFTTQTSVNTISARVKSDEENTTRHQADEEDVNNSHHAPSDTKFADCKFTCIRVSIEKLKIIVSSLETIKGIFTIFQQDLPKTSQLRHGFDLLNKTSVMFLKSVHIFTAHPLQYNFVSESLKTRPDITMETVVKKIEQSKLFSLVINDTSIQESVVNALKETHIQKAGIFIVGNTHELLFLPNVNIRRTDLTNILKDVDSQLACFAFEILKSVHTNLQMLTRENTLAEHDVAKHEDMLDLIKSALRNSDIPADDIPEEVMSEECLYPANTTEVIEKVVAIPGAIVCFKKRGKLHIYIYKSTMAPDTEQLILNKLLENGVNKCSFVYGQTKRFAVRKTGNYVFQAYETLGGFAKKVALPSFSIRDQSEESPPNANARSANTVALVSCHVVQQALFLLSVMDVGFNPISLDNVGNIQQPANIDILPWDVNEDFELFWDPRFKTEDNISMFSKLRKSDDISIVVANDGIAANGLMILVRDRYEDQPFAQEGDSGAMVCYFDQRNEVVYAVAMLIESVQLQGESTSTRYKAQILDDGLQKLSIATGYQFLIFEDEGEDCEHA